MDDNNLVKEMYPEQVKSINPYDISYIAMKNGSIIMIIEKSPPKNYLNKIYNKNEQSSPNFNSVKNNHISYTTREKKEIEENNNFNYSFRFSDNINNINEDKNPCLIEKRKYIFYKKSNNKDKEDIKNINTFNHSKTFSYSNTTPIKRKNNLENSENSNSKNKYNDSYYNNISISHSKYSSKKNKNKSHDFNFSYGFIKSKSESIYLNNNTNNIISNDDNYEIHKKPKI